MLYREIMAVCSEIHTKHVNTVCGQNVELLNVKPVRTNTYQSPAQRHAIQQLKPVVNLYPFCGEKHDLHACL